MSLEEVGPAPPVGEHLLSQAATPRHASPRKTLLQQQHTPSLSATPRHRPPRPQFQQQHEQGHRAEVVPAEEAQGQPQQPQQAAAWQPQQSQAASAAANPQQSDPPAGPAELPTEEPVCESQAAAAAAAAAAPEAAGAMPVSLGGCMPSGTQVQVAQQEDVSPNVGGEPANAGAGAGSCPSHACDALPEAQPVLLPKPPPPVATAAAGTAPSDIAAPAELAEVLAVAVRPPAAAPTAPAAPAQQQPSVLQALAPEIEAAWELEMWKRQEEERWKAELRQRELDRMVSLSLCQPSHA
jgi:centrosomal protein CEP120